MELRTGEECFDAPQHRCCCNRCHSETGTIVIGFVTGILWGSALIKTLHSYVTYQDQCLLQPAEAGVYALNCEKRREAVVEEVIVGIVYLLAIVCLFLAICHKGRFWLTPFLIVTMLCAIWIIVLLVGEIIEYPIPGFSSDSIADIMPKSIFISILSSALVLQLIFLLTLVKCYRYFLALAVYRKTSMNGGHGSYHNIPPPPQTQ